MRDTSLAEMAYVTPIYDRARVDAAGAALAARTETEEDRGVVNNWRWAHHRPLVALRVNMDRRARHCDPKGSFVAQRLKRFESIAIKLHEKPRLTLSMLQDIGGCRAVMGDVPKVQALVAACTGAKEFSTRLIANLGHDYIAKPKADGYAILSHKDRADLKPGQYIMLTDKRRPAFARGISKETRAVVLERNGFTCQSCGLAAADPDPFHPGRKVRLTMGHTIDKSKGGSDDADNLRAICTNCNEGLQNASRPKPDLVWLISQVRRAPVDDQLAVLTWLNEKYANVRGKPPA